LDNIESYDIGIAGNILPLLQQRYQLTTLETALLAIASTLGIVVAIIPAGWLADTIGREKVLIIGTAWYAVFSLFCGFAPNVLAIIMGASAALTGLIFVGVSINLTKIAASPILTNRALQALVALVVVLFVSSLLLIPEQSFLAVGIEVLLLGLINWSAALFLQIDSIRKMQAQYRGAYVRGILVSQIAALSFVIAGIILLIWGTTGFYWIVAATLFSFLAAFFEVWRLIASV
jgi:MFS family permease